MWGRRHSYDYLSTIVPKAGMKLSAIEKQLDEGKSAEQIAQQLETPEPASGTIP